MTTRAGLPLFDLLSRAEHEMSRRVSATLQAEGLNLDQWRVLTRLVEGKGQTTSDVAEHVMLPPATMTRIVDRLVETNLIYRRGDPMDRRRVLLFLSARGRSLHGRVAPAVEQEEAVLTAAFDATEREQLAVLLERLARPE